MDAAAIAVMRYLYRSK